MDYTKEITVDLSGQMYFNYITAVQGDEKSRFVKVKIISNGLTFSPPAGARATIRCKKPDGTFVLNDATIGSDGTITAELTENMLAVVGNCNCEITIYHGESSLTTVPFLVKVTPGAVNPYIASTDEYTALTKALAEAQSALEAASDATSEANDASANVAEAIQKANTAISSAQAAAAAAREAAAAVGDKIDGVIIIDNDDNTKYLGKFRISSGHPALEVTKI